ncbi:MAG: DNA replication complex GINS family protein [Candidatus Aenigmarchaeota archaeon]|nr:DNA replication complex GINS family protein [Candidatus Aenigmarchaeota archaeon]
MPEETITFELIRKIQVEEQKDTGKLTRLPTNFFNAISGYLEQKRNIVSDDDRKSVLEMKGIERLVEEIFNRRERKIINSAIIAARNGMPPENLGEEERPFYNSIVGLIKNRRNDLLKSVLTGKVEKSSPEVTFKEDIPAFVGIDEKTYGPFKKGDIAALPPENTRTLLERGVAEEAK